MPFNPFEVVLPTAGECPLKWAAEPFSRQGELAREQQRSSQSLLHSSSGVESIVVEEEGSFEITDMGAGLGSGISAKMPRLLISPPGGAKLKRMEELRAMASVGAEDEILMRFVGAGRSEHNFTREDLCSLLDIGGRVEGISVKLMKMVLSNLENQFPSISVSWGEEMPSSSKRALLFPIEEEEGVWRLVVGYPSTRSLVLYEPGPPSSQQLEQNSVLEKVLRSFKGEGAWKTQRGKDIWMEEEPHESGIFVMMYAVCVASEEEKIISSMYIPYYRHLLAENLFDKTIKRSRKRQGANGEPKAKKQKTEPPLPDIDLFKCVVCMFSASKVVNIISHIKHMHKEIGPEEIVFLSENLKPTKQPEYILKDYCERNEAALRKIREKKEKQKNKK